jgi:hypothetical protein
MIAWSTAPRNGNGIITIYAGSLQASAPVYQHSAANCPCWRVFSFWRNSLLLTDDHGDHGQVHSGLWLLDLSSVTTKGPQPLLTQASTEIPLALSPNNMLLYTNMSGVVPLPSDNTVPDETASSSYAGNLLLAPLDGKQQTSQTTQALLSEPRKGSPFLGSSWIMAPTFSPDGNTLIYISFSSTAQPPFGRTNALYGVQLSKEGSTQRAGKPALLATTFKRFVEPGAWLDNHTLTFYADGSLYALDTRSGATATIAEVQTYARIAVITN